MRKKKLGFWETVYEDMRVCRIHRPGIFTGLWHLLVGPGFLAVFLHRVASACYSKGLLGRAAGKFFWRLNVLFNSCDIKPQAKIGPGLNLPHPCGIVIGIAEIGNNVTILQNVTLGLKDIYEPDDDIRARPRIGNDVVVYAGAVVSGRINVGDGAWIGANAVVIKDVPENSLAVGVPAKVVKRLERNSNRKQPELKKS